MRKQPPPVIIEDTSVPCRDCAGTGLIRKDVKYLATCQTCNGTKRVPA